MRRWSALIALAAMAAAIDGVAAQDAVAAWPADAPDCLSRTVAGEAGAAPVLHVACRGRGFVIGPVDEYRLLHNKGLKAALVDTVLQGSRRIWLVTIRDDGQPFLEELTGQIALAAGRGSMSDLDGLELDARGFAAAGALAVGPAAGGAPGRDRAGAIDLVPQIAARRGE